MDTMGIELTADSSFEGRGSHPPPEVSRSQGACLLESTPPGSRHLLGASAVPSGDEVSIRLPSRPDWRVCGSCSVRFHATGPTGYLGRVAICDPCALEHSEALGSLLFLGLAVRAFVGFEAIDRGQRYRALDELGVVARVYERMVAPWGPARSVVLADLLAEGDGPGQAGSGEVDPEEGPVQG